MHSNGRARSPSTYSRTQKSQASQPTSIRRHLTATTGYKDGASTRGDQHFGTSSPSEELRGIVERNREHQILVQHTTDAVHHMAMENSMMEEILAEKHVMVTNVDLAVIVQNAMTNPDGSVNSAILASRKPPRRQMMQRVKASGNPLGADALKTLTDTNCPDKSLLKLARDGLIGGKEDIAQKPENEGLINTGKVNFKVLLEDEAQMMKKVEEQRVSYDRDIKSFVKKQQSLHDRFSGIV